MYLPIIMSKHEKIAFAVQHALEGQIRAWNDGDINLAMTFYWNTPEMLWINKSGIQKGYESVLADFKTEFADPKKMGIYSYSPLHIEVLSESSAYFVIDWKIELEGNRLMGGISSQLWRLVEGRWVVVAEHAS